MKNENNLNQKWYNNELNISNIMITLIAIIIIFSQAFAIREDLFSGLLGSVINHNSFYFLILAYFIVIKFNFGKKYFNYLNIILIFLYSFIAFTSLLTVVQAFSLNTMLVFTLNFVFAIYLIHTFFRDTILWKELRLSNSPFNELTNEWLFNCVLLVSVFLLLVQLISTVDVRGVVISVLDMLYYVFFARYIFLYRDFLDKKKVDINNTGNFDEAKKLVKEVVENTSEKVEDALDDISDKVKEAVDASGIKEKVEDIKDKAEDAIETSNIKEKVEDIKDKTEDVVKESKTTKKTKKGAKK